MSAINLEFSFQKLENHKFLQVKTLDTEWKQFDTAYILGEVVESLLLGTYDEIHFDFSSLNFVSSSCLGSFVSLSEKAKELKKEITLDFGAQIKKTIWL